MSERISSSPSRGFDASDEVAGRMKNGHVASVSYHASREMGEDGTEGEEEKVELSLSQSRSDGKLGR